MKTRLLSAAVLLLLAATAHAANVRITNHSDWEIHELYVSSSADDEWGQDQLREDVIETGGTFTLRNIPCDTYDVKLVDEDQDVCEVPEVDICGSAQSWVITNDDLLECQGN